MDKTALVDHLGFGNQAKTTDEFDMQTASSVEWSLSNAPAPALHWHGRPQALVSPTALAKLAALLDVAEKAELPVHSPDVATIDVLLKSGFALESGPEKQLTVHRDLLWQLPSPWLRNSNGTAYPVRYVMTGGKRHPLRPAKPTGVVYTRHIPWLGRALSLRTIDAERDIARFHRWMNDPVVAEFWQEEGDMEKHRQYIHTIATDPHVIGLIASLGDVPFAYFEVYWAKEDRIAPFYDADDFDRGWHVLVGEPAYRGKPFVTAWLPSISHYLFLDDYRTQRVVLEPRFDNKKMIRNITKTGYAVLKEFDFPHKRAALGMLSRERFFGEAYWNPRPE